MTDDRFSRQPLAAWYMPAAVLSLLLMLVPLIGAFVHLSADPATLPLDHRVQHEAVPLWVIGAFGLAGVAGTIGGLMLLLRRRAAEPLMLAALIFTCAWFAGLFVTPKLRQLLAADQIAIALAALAIAWTIFWFARHSRQRGWLN